MTAPAPKRGQLYVIPPVVWSRFVDPDVMVPYLYKGWGGHIQHKNWYLDFTIKEIRRHAETIHLPRSVVLTSLGGPSKYINGGGPHIYWFYAAQRRVAVEVFNIREKLLIPV